MPDHTTTHEVSNQPPALAGYNAWSANPLLIAAVDREGGGWISREAATLGEVVGSDAFHMLIEHANRYPPELCTHDRGGRRIDAVEFHPAYHELMRLT